MKTIRCPEKWKGCVTALLMELVLVATGTTYGQERKAMQDIPLEVQEYLSAGDGLGQVAVEEAHPNVKATLNAPETRNALLRYLASDDPWVTPTPGFSVNALTFVLSGATPEEAEFVRPLLLHPVPEVRVRAYNFLVAVAAGDRGMLVALLQSMLLDSDDMVRVAGVRHIERTETAGQLRTFLQRWMKLAPARGWEGEESYELLEQLLRK